MHSFRRQRTIRETAVVEGFGYWSGRDIRVEFHPAPAHAGLVFVRTDLPGNQRVAAMVGNRIEVDRRTSLRFGDADVHMVEHIMAALGGLRIDNCEIRVDQPEMPGCDGSSQAFVKALDTAGIIEQTAWRKSYTVDQVIRRGDADSWIEARPAAPDELVLSYQLDYGPDNAIGRQEFSLVVTPESFRRELAASRTFMLRHEAEQFRTQGLGQRTTFADLLVFDVDGPIDNTLRFADECARHKLLDMVGDLALAESDPLGRFDAYCSGHRLNAELLRGLLCEDDLDQPARRSA